MCYNSSMLNNSKNGGALASEDLDRLYVTVKRDKLDDCLNSYRAFGWILQSSEPHRIYENLVNLSFRRPHKIINKDDLQLLQVYYETAINSIGKLEKLPRPRTVAFSLVSWFIIAALMVASFVFYVLSANYLYSVLGWVCLGAGVALIIPTVVFTLKLNGIEGRMVDAKLKLLNEAISLTLSKAELLKKGGSLTEFNLAEGGNE